MHLPSGLYRDSLALLTDLYELTMAYGYWKTGVAEHEAAFALTYRRSPFNSGYTLACGLAYAVDLIEYFRFAPADLEYLAGLRGGDGQRLFEQAFLDFISELRLAVDVDAVPEGTVVFPHEPLARVRGPILLCQLLETPLLNFINFQSLIATKAARVCLAAQGEPVLEFGLRRAQGIDGGLTVARAAYVGGCEVTSNVLAGRLFGIPVRGTHAHSWVMAFDSELDAFAAYADALPNNCTLLVDTYDTLAGVRHAIEVGRRLRAGGHKLQAIRLDSGDLAWLSQQARRMLDEAGFRETKVLASGDLDEHLITSLKHQGAAIVLWGVGTRLATGWDDPALPGVYKLTALRRPGREWEYKLKLSEQVAKTSIPGMLQVRRFRADGEFAADMIYDELRGPGESRTLIDPTDATRRKTLPPEAEFEDLLVPIFRRGRRVYDVPPLSAVRARAEAQLRALHPAIKRLVNPHEYRVGLEPGLHDLRTELILTMRAAD